MREIERVILEKGWTQAQAARHTGVTQPRINDLLRGKIGKFSVDALINMAGALGLRVSLHFQAA